jgi:chromosome segregation ATPase
MKIETVKAVVRGFDNSGGVIRSDNLHALADSYESALARLTAVEAERDSFRNGQEQAQASSDHLFRVNNQYAEERKELLAQVETLTKELAGARAAAEASANVTAACREETEAIRALADGREEVRVRLRDALKLKMAEYQPHAPGFCAACDAAREALK